MTQLLFPLFFLIVSGIGIASFVVWILAIVDMVNNTAIQGTEKIVWALVVIFLQVIGAIIYFAAAPRSKKLSS